MKAHVQNASSRRPSLMVNMSVEEATQLRSALDWVNEGVLSQNELAALSELRRNLEHAFSNPPPRGLKGVVP